MEFSHQLKYKSPVIKAQDDWALIYDSGNTAYSVVTGYAVIHKGKTQGSIITAAVSESGSYAIVSKVSGYRSGITVFSKKHKELCSWDTPSEYIMMVSLSPEGDRFVCLSVSSDGKNMIYRLTSRNKKTGELIFDNKLSYNEIYSIKHTKDGELLIFTDTCIATLGKNGKVKVQVDFNGRKPIGFSHYEQDDCMVVFDGDRIGEIYAVVYNENCKEIYNEIIYGDFRDCDCKKGTYSVLVDSRLIWKSEKGSGSMEEINARGVLSGADGVPILVFADSIERLGEK
jgi:WD40 repeat protein